MVRCIAHHRRMNAVAPPLDRKPRPGWAALKVPVALLLSYWIGVYLVGTAWTLLLGQDPWAYAEARIYATLFGVGMATLIGVALFGFRRLPFPVQVLLALLFALVAALGYKLFSGWLFYGMATAPEAADQREAFAQSLFYWTATFFGWGTSVIALLYNMAVREREQRLGELRAQAYDAQMRALHYQISPHFLFNTLNAVASLIERGENDTALEVVVNLSGFLRQTLELDPLERVPLRAEFDLQAAYLEIERQRFSDRLDLQLHLPPELETASVPALIIQPLVENAMKHGISRNVGRGRIRIAASSLGDRLVLEVRNSYPDTEAIGHRNGIGLANVRSRLGSIFGNGAHLTADREGDEWVARVDLPLEESALV